MLSLRLQFRVAMLISQGWFEICTMQLYSLWDVGLIMWMHFFSLYARLAALYVPQPDSRIVSFVW